MVGCAYVDIHVSRNLMECRTNKSFGMSSRRLALHPTFELNCDRQVDYGVVVSTQDYWICFAT